MHHGDTRQAHIGLAWQLGIKPDKDGRIMLGRCIKCSDLNREFADYDFIITLNKIVWDDPEFDKKKKLALPRRSWRINPVTRAQEPGQS